MERAEAKRLGLKHYFTGRPCSRGHIAKRYIGGDCVECVKLYLKLYPEDPEHVKQRMKRWTMANAEHIRAYNLRNRQRQLEYSRQHRLRNIERERKREREYQDNHRPLYKYHNANRHALRYQPPCSNPEVIKAIKAFYLACPTDKVVDHIIPLGSNKQPGKTIEGYPIRGLHVTWNLQYLLYDDNRKKRLIMRPQDLPLAPRIKRPSH